MVWSLTDKTGPQPTKWPPAPPKTAITWAPGTHGTPNRVHRVRIQHAIKFGLRAFHPERPPRPGNPPFRLFWPVWGPGRPRNSPRPQKSSKSRSVAAGGQTIENAKCTKLRNTKAVPIGPKIIPEKSPLALSYGRNGGLPETYSSTRVRTRDLTLLGWGTGPKNQ